VLSNDTGEATTQLQRLVDAMLAQVELLSERSAVGFQEMFPSYARQDRAALTPAILRNTVSLLESIRDPERDPLDDLAFYRAAGEERARMGITNDEMLHAWRIGLEVTRKHAYSVAHELGIGDDVLLAFIEAMLRHGDAAMLESASAHRQTELEMARHEEHHRANLVRGILFGTLAPAAIRVQAATYGLDAEGPYCAIRARPTAEVTVRALECHLQIADGAGPRRGLAALLDGDVAGFVRAPVRGPTGVPIGVGPPAALDGLENSFRLATRALESATATDLTGPVAIDQLGLLPAVIADRDVGDEVLRRIIDPVLAQGKPGATLLDTVARYLENDLRLELTAEQMFLHVNTVRYRLRRFEELTGTSLRHVDDLVQVWWALRRRGLPRQEGQT
jgi:PucR C-terminal helix-turn-helix domain